MTGPRRPWRTLIAIASLLVIGAAAGVTVDRLAQAHLRAGAIDLRAVHEDPLGTIERVIDLRPDQRTHVAAILQARQADINSAWHETHVRLDATVDSVITEIVAVLDSSQAARFIEMAERLHGRRFMQHR